MVDLHAKPIAITGASSGIGRATAFACAQAGMLVALMARRSGPLEELAREINESGGRATPFEGDVADPESCRAFIDHAQRELGPLHAVFANAGYGFEKPTWSTPEDELRRMFEVNFWGSLNVIRPALDGMVERRRGHVIFCSSCLSKIAVPSYGAYSASKACQDHFGRAMRHELKGVGVHVSTVHPIGTRTEFFDTAARHSGGELRLMDRTKESFMQTPERVADAVVRCLRKPKGEVWTSRSMRLLLGLATVAPGLADTVLGAMQSRRMSGDR